MDEEQNKFAREEKKSATLVTNDQLDAVDKEIGKFSTFKVPNLSQAPGGDVERKVFNAFFDGTFNNAAEDRHHQTNVFYMHEKVQAAISSSVSSRDVVASYVEAASSYVPGPGTGKNTQYSGVDGDSLAGLRAAARDAEVPKVDPPGRLRKLKEMATPVGNSLKYVATRPSEKVGNSRNSDGLKGWSADSRAETMYERLAKQTATWKDDAKIRGKEIEVVVSTCGFSRGGDTSALFLNKVEERGIRNPATFDMKIDKSGLRSFTEKPAPVQNQQPGGPSTAPEKHLVGAGKVPMTGIFFDPVGTGDLVNNHNRQLPAGMIAGLQITALEEKRPSFKVSTIIPAEGPNNSISEKGQSKDGRFLSVGLPADHADVGGGHAIDGMSSRSCNFGVNFYNTLNPTNAIPLRDEPHRGETYVHDMTKASLLFNTEAKAASAGARVQSGTNTVVGPVKGLFGKGDAVPPEFNTKGTVDRTKAEGQNRIVNPKDPDSTQQPLAMSPGFNAFREPGNLSVVSFQKGAQLHRQDFSGMMDSLSDAAHRHSSVPRGIATDPSNPALQARAQGAQTQAAQRQGAPAQAAAALASQRDQPQTSVDAPKSPTQGGGAPGR